MNIPHIVKHKQAFEYFLDHGKVFVYPSNLINSFTGDPTPHIADSSYQWESSSDICLIPDEHLKFRIAIAQGHNLMVLTNPWTWIELVSDDPNRMFCSKYEYAIQGDML